MRIDGGKREGVMSGIFGATRDPSSAARGKAPAVGDRPLRGSADPKDGLGRTSGWIWAPFIVFVVATGALAAADIRAVFEPPWLQAAIKFAFVVGASFVSAALASQGYRAGGSVPVLLLGCSMVLFGSANLLGSVLVSLGRANEGTTVSNIGSLLAGMSHLAGASSLIFGRPLTKARPARRFSSAAAFGSCFAVMAALTAVAWKNLLPQFMTSAGTTTVRTVVLLVTVAEYLISASMFASMRRKTGMRFLGMYWLGLAQIGVGLTASALARFGSPLSWTGRAAQCSGLIYILAGLLVLLREKRTRGLSAGELLAASFRLLQSQHQFRSIIEELHEGVWLTDADGATQYVNPCIERMIGYTREELFGRGILEFAETGGLERVGSGPGGRPISRVEEIEARFRRKDGSVLWTRTTASPISDGGGAFSGTLWLLHDLTPQRRAEEAVRETEARLKLATEAARIGMWYWNISTGQIDFTEQTYALYGLSAGEPVTLERVRSVIHPDDRRGVDLALRDARGAGGDRELEHRVVKPDGSIRWLLLKGHAAAGGDGKPLLYTGVVIDITDRKSAQMQLEELNETLERRVIERTTEARALADQLRALAVELGQVEQRERRRLAKILHDHIQQLLAAARMRIELLGRKTGGKTDVAADIREIESLVIEALEASRTLAIELCPPALQMAGLAGGITWLASWMAEKNQFIVHFAEDRGAEPETEDTRFLLFECVRELLFNAHKHSGVREASVNMSRSAAGDIAIEVSDRGKGFEPDRAANFNPKKTTFGLFSIQQRLNHISGRMEIDSAPGRGTRIVLTVPMLRPQAPPQLRGRA